VILWWICDTAINVCKTERFLGSSDFSILHPSQSTSSKNLSYSKTARIGPYCKINVNALWNHIVIAFEQHLRCWSSLLIYSRGDFNARATAVAISYSRWTYAIPRIPSITMINRINWLEIKTRNARINMKINLWIVLISLYYTYIIEKLNNEHFDTDQIIINVAE